MDSKGKKTEINSNLGNRDTVINQHVQSGRNFTEVNPAVRNSSIELPKGTVLADKYVVDVPLSTNTGEANLYLCDYQGQRYVAKVYRRQAAIKSDITHALVTIDSPHVAKLYETGTWNGAPFEIIPYYKFGSLEGKTFTYHQLKSLIIPALNNGLQALHKNNIIHKDLKPSNIMLCDDQKSVAIIDFGISSIRDAGNTVVVTKTGMTPEYSAPETFRNLFLEESDYYSLGVTLYELFCGHTPYAGADRDLIERYIAVQRIPFPDNFPEPLKRLITGLTYNDITNRRDKNNPNRRWTYDEVRRWCAGETLPEPGGTTSVVYEQPSPQAGKIPPITFQYKRYTSVADLAEALGNDWDNGKRRLYRSFLTEHFRKVDPELANFCMDAEEAARKDRTRADAEFFKVLYRMSPTMKSLHWKDYHAPSMNDFGYNLMEWLNSSEGKIPSTVDDMVKNRIFSAREEIVHHAGQSNAKALAAVEGKYILASEQSDRRAQLEQLYILAYYYSRTRSLETSMKEFQTVEELVAFVHHIIEKDPDRLDQLSEELMVSGVVASGVMSGSATGKRTVQSTEAQPSPRLAAWLTLYGKRQAK